MLTSPELYLPRLIPFLPKITTAIVMQAAEKAACDFIERVPVWTEDIVIDGIEDQSEYIINLEDVGDNLHAKEIRELLNSDDRIICRWNYRYDSSSGILTLVDALTPYEDEAGAWTAKVHVAGLFDCDLFPDHVLNQYAEPIIGKTFSLLCNVPGRPWFNPALAERGERDYRVGVQRAMITQGPAAISG